MREWTERWSDLWVMLTSVGTLVAVGVAIWSAAREATSRKAAEERAVVAEGERAAERQRSDKEKADQIAAERLKQARQVIAWVEHRPASPQRPHWDSTGAKQLKHEHVLRYVNHSDAPTFEVALHIYWQSRNTDALVSKVAVLPAGVEGEVIVPSEHQEGGFEVTGFVLFRDLNGQRWRRWENGYLTEMDEYWREVATAPVR